LILRDEAWAIYRANLAHLIEIIKAISGLTEAQLEAYGIAAAKGGGAHSPKAPDEVPDLVFKLKKPREVEINFGAKPKGVLYAEFVFKLGGEKPKKIEEFDEAASATKTPYTKKHDEDQRFMVLYVMGRFVSTTGMGGAWSEIYAVVVP
jgi:hypothetical protein